MRHIDLKLIVSNNELYPRVRTDWVTIRKYKESLLAGAKFPPIIVRLRQGRYKIVDGVHRVEAYRQAGKRVIPAIIKQKTLSGMSQRQIFQNALSIIVGGFLDQDDCELMATVVELKKALKNVG